MTSREKWKSVVGYEGIYEVSALGRVRSLDRKIRHRSGGLRRWRGRILVPVKRFQYWAVSLHKNGMQDTKQIQSLVMTAFIGGPPNNMEICHNDGDGRNNTLTNLRYDTRASNCEDRKRHGTAPVGSRHGQAKLTETDVLEIRRLAVSTDQRILAKKFNVSQSSISQIITETTWRHI